MNYNYKSPKTSMYIYNVRGKDIFGSVKFKTKVKTVQDMLDEIKDVKNSLIKKYKTKKIFILKDTGNKEWMAI
jgi:hypothetical protein